MPSPGLDRRTLLGWVLGVGFFLGLIAFLQASVGWRVLLGPWKQLSPGRVIGALGLVVASYGIRAIRVHRYFHPDTTGGFSGSFRLILLHNLFNNILPMRTGEASFPILMARTFQVPLSRSIAGLFYLRFLDLHLLMILGAVVLLSGRGPTGWLLAAGITPLPLFLFAAQGRLESRLSDSPGPLGKFLAKGIRGFPSTPTLFWVTWGWTVVNWSVKLSVFAWILQTFSPMPSSTAFLGSVTGELSSVLPFHGLAGAGTYEAGVMAGLLPLGIPLDSALTGAVNLHLFVLGVSLLSGVMALALPRGRHGRDTGPDYEEGGDGKDSRENPESS
jgi:uncharacterized membrane protein YbhN (UPF0104 family)